MSTSSLNISVMSNTYSNPLSFSNIPSDRPNNLNDSYTGWGMNINKQPEPLKSDISAISNSYPAPFLVGMNKDPYSFVPINPPAENFKISEGLRKLKELQAKIQLEKENEKLR